MGFLLLVAGGEEGSGAGAEVVMGGCRAVMAGCRAVRSGLVGGGEEGLGAAGARGCRRHGLGAWKKCSRREV
jgi:hypothetical protein